MSDEFRREVSNYCEYHEYSGSEEGYEDFIERSHYEWLPSTSTPQVSAQQPQRIAPTEEKNTQKSVVAKDSKEYQKLLELRLSLSILNQN